MDASVEAVLCVYGVRLPGADVGVGETWAGPFGSWI